MIGVCFDRIHSIIFLPISGKWSRMELDLDLDLISSRQGAVEGFSQYDNILIIWRDKNLPRTHGVTSYFEEVKKVSEFTVSIIFFYLGIGLYLLLLEFQLWHCKFTPVNQLKRKCQQTIKTKPIPRKGTARMKCE